MSKQPIRVLSNLARSGGTLVSRCLGAMDNTVLLSEIHPLGMHMFNPIAQARDWYSLLRPGEFEDRRHSFIDAITLVAQRCQDTGKTLVIRDWAHLDFIGVPFLKYPACRLQLNDALAPTFDVISFALVRHPIDQWLSTMRLKVMEGQLSLDSFLAGYRRFAEQAATSGFMRYEDFTQNPLAHMQLLCRRMDIEFDAGFVNKWQQNMRVTGDVSGMSRGSGFDDIKPLAKHRVDKSLLKKFRRNPDYHRALDLLGYMDPPISR